MSDILLGISLYVVGSFGPPDSYVLSIFRQLLNPQPHVLIRSDGSEFYQTSMYVLPVVRRYITNSTAHCQTLSKDCHILMISFTLDCSLEAQSICTHYSLKHHLEHSSVCHRLFSGAFPQAVRRLFPRLFSRPFPRPFTKIVPYTNL